jgi:hypothetical protein
VSVISVDPRRKLGQLHRYVYGGFIEHLGRCIYGGIYEEGSPLSDTRGFRTDVLDLLKQLRISQLRWPGGNFVSNYHWQDGIGPKDTRPVREPGKAEIRLRDGLFGAAVRVRTLTGSNKPKQPRGAEQVELSDTSTNTNGNGAVLDLPPKSFTLLEASLEA